MTAGRLNGFGPGFRPAVNSYAIKGGKPVPTTSRVLSGSNNKPSNHVKFGTASCVTYIPLKSIITERADMTARRYDILFDVCEDFGYIRHPNILKTDDAGSVQAKIVQEYVAKTDLRRHGFSYVSILPVALVDSH